MMAEKARLFNDADALEKILSAPHPSAAKKYGRFHSPHARKISNAKIAYAEKCAPFLNNKSHAPAFGKAFEGWADK